MFASPARKSIACNVNTLSAVFEIQIVNVIQIYYQHLDHRLTYITGFGR